MNDAKTTHEVSPSQTGTALVGKYLCTMDGLTGSRTHGLHSLHTFGKRIQQFDDRPEFKIRADLSDETLRGVVDARARLEYPSKSVAMVQVCRVNRLRGVSPK
jgi:hypothetical protein